MASETAQAREDAEEAPGPVREGPAGGADTAGGEASPRGAVAGGGSSAGESKGEMTSSAGHVAARRARVAQAWALGDEIVLIGAGDRIVVPGTGDQTYPFRSHPEYFYLTDRECPGAVLAFDPKEGWTDFVPDVTEKERIWEARTQADGTSIALLGAWLAQ